MKDEVEQILRDNYNNKSTNDEAIAALLALIDKAQVEAVRAARIDELNRTIEYFYDENRESKTVLRAFKAQRIANLEEYKQTPEEEFDQYYMGDDRGGADFASD